MPGKGNTGFHEVDSTGQPKAGEWRASQAEVKHLVSRGCQLFEKSAIVVRIIVGEVEQSHTSAFEIIPTKDVAERNIAAELLPCYLTQFVWLYSFVRSRA